MSDQEYKDAYKRMHLNQFKDENDRKVAREIWTTFACALFWFFMIALILYTSTVMHENEKRTDGHLSIQKAQTEFIDHRPADHRRDTVAADLDGLAEVAPQLLVSP